MPRKLTTKEFIDRAKAIHGDCYDYSLVDYKHSNSKVKIICRQHGIFEQRAVSHLQGHGCSKCSNNAKPTTQEFIERAKAVHGNDRYDYSLVDYKGSDEKVTIICPQHGEFEQSAYHHLRGHGCPTCKKERVGWNRSSWKEQGENSKDFDGFKLYVVKLTSETETFLKVGITFKKLNKRMYKSPYEWVEVLTIEGSAEYIYDLENEIHREIKDYRYTPQIEFKGQTECFSMEALEEILEKFAKRDIIN